MQGDLNCFLWQISSQEKISVLDGVVIAEITKKAFMSKARMVFGTDAIPEIVCGHAEEKLCHQHLFYLPIDLDFDGYIDHICIYSPVKLDKIYLEIAAKIRKLFFFDKDIFLLPLVFGNAKQTMLPFFSKSKFWIAVTPWCHPWHLKKDKFEFREQLIKECKLSNLPEITNAEFYSVNPNPLSSALNFPFKTKRFGKNIATHGIFQRFPKIEFTNEVDGLLCLGVGKHHGLGMFMPIDAV